MDEKGLIPIPTLQQWRRVRARVVPALVLCAVVVGCSLVWRAKFATGQPPTPNLVCSDITSPVSGKVAEVTVERLQSVQAGGVIARILATDAQVLQASLKVILSELSLLRIRAGAAALRAPDEAAGDQLRLDLMEARVELVMARARMESASVELAKAESLWARNLAPLEAVEAASAQVEQLQVEIEDRLERLTELGQNLARLDAAEGEPSPDQGSESLAAAMRKQEAKLLQAEAELVPIELKVDCDGTITAIHRRCGDRIVAGQPVATVTMTVPGRAAPAQEEPQDPAMVLAPGGASEVSRPFGPRPNAPHSEPATAHRSAQASL